MGDLELIPLLERRGTPLIGRQSTSGHFETYRNKHHSHLHSHLQAIYSHKLTCVSSNWENCRKQNTERKRSPRRLSSHEMLQLASPPLGWGQKHLNQANDRSHPSATFLNVCIGKNQSNSFKVETHKFCTHRPLCEKITLIKIETALLKNGITDFEGIFLFLG